MASKFLAYGTEDEAETQYDYDDDGNLISLIDPNENETTWTFEDGREIEMVDPLGQIDPEGHTVTKTYDEDGRLESILNRNGLLRTFEYDEDGRLHEEVWYAGATDILLTLDILPVLVSARNRTVPRRATAPSGSASPKRSIRAFFSTGGSWARVRQIGLAKSQTAMKFESGRGIIISKPFQQTRTTPSWRDHPVCQDRR